MTQAMASSAQKAGAEIRTEAEVVSIRTKNARVVGVELADGSTIDTSLVVSAADPKRTLRMCDPVELGPLMVWRAENIRQPGATAKVNLALSGLPAFNGAEGVERLHGRIVIGPTLPTSSV